MVTVKDAQGKLVGSLDKDIFSVYDLGVKQDIAVFERHTALPLSVSVLIDNSGSTGKDLRYELQSVEKFLLRAFLRKGTRPTSRRCTRSTTRCLCFRRSAGGCLA